MPNCAKERRLDVGIWCETMPDCAKERRLDVESTDVLDITLLSNSSAPQFCANLSGMMTNCAKLHYSFGPRGASNCYIFNRHPAEHCCGQIWHGVVKQEDTNSYVISTGVRKLELTTL